MTKVPSLHYKEILSALQRDGWSDFDSFTARVMREVMETKREFATAPQALGSDVQLNDRLTLGIPIRVWEVGAQHQKNVTGLKRSMTRGEADESSHAHVVRIVKLDRVFPPQRVHDWSLESFGEHDELIVGDGASCARENCYPLASV